MSTWQGDLERKQAAQAAHNTSIHAMAELRRVGGLRKRGLREREKIAECQPRPKKRRAMSPMCGRFERSLRHMGARMPPGMGEQISPSKIFYFEISHSDGVKVHQVSWRVCGPALPFLASPSSVCSSSPLFHSEHVSQMAA